MRTAQLIVTVVLSLGLAVPGAHGVVLCLNEHGEFALELSLDGTCAGAQEPTSRSRTSGAQGGALAQAAAGCYGGCRDVTLSSNDTAPHSPDSMVRRLLQTSGSVDAQPVDSSMDGPGRSGMPLRSAESASIHGPPICRTVVLRL
jgi:hypothetical protein